MVIPVLVQIKEQSWHTFVLHFLHVQVSSNHHQDIESTLLPMISSMIAAAMRSNAAANFRPSQDLRLAATRLDSLESIHPGYQTTFIPSRSMGFHFCQGEVTMAVDERHAVP